MNWQRLAPLYNAQLRLERPGLRAAIRLGEPRKTDRILDVGTGTGALLRELLRTVSNPAEVVGIDASEDMLARAAVDLPSHVRLERGDARSLALPSESFDLVFSTYLLNVVSSADGLAIIAEARRMLAPGGRLVVVAAVTPRSFLARPYSALWRGLGRTLPSLFGSFRLVDPAGCLSRAGMDVQTRTYVRRGYPSLCAAYVAPRLQDGDKPLRKCVEV